MAKAAIISMRSALANRVGRPAIMMKLVGRPGEAAALTADGFAASYHALAGPSWRNEIEVDAAVALELGAHRADRAAERISAPVLVQIADADRAAPPRAAAKAAFKARAEVRHYPCDHFDVFSGNEWFASTVEHQLHFLRRQLIGNAAGHTRETIAERPNQP